MRTDSAGWAIGFAGCLVDWLITRKWGRIAVGLVPVLAAAIVGGLVAWGSMLDRDRLAERYLKLADAEVAQWENAWAPVNAPSETTPAADAVQAAGDAPPNPAGAVANTDAEQAIPRFAEVLFRRVQQLQSGDQRSVFFVAMILAQRGSVPQALSLLARIAPDDREGYAPAHAWLAEHYLGQPINAANLQPIKHHARAALAWPRTSPSLLATIGQFFWRAGDRETAVRSLEIAAERDPKFHLQLASLTSRGEKWKLLREKSLTKAETHLTALLTSSPHEVETRMQLISARLLKNDFAGAEQIALEGRQLRDDPRLRHAHSEIYRLQFAATMSLADSTWSGNIELLNRAFHTDPTNVKIFEEVAQLARLSGELPNAELEAELNKLLAEGKATSITHLWIAEHYLVTGAMQKAVPHLEQALQRSPNAIYCLNNLAYCLATLYPNRREEALTYIDRAIALDVNQPAYHDTRGTVLISLDRPKEAIAAFERAVELLHQTGQPPKTGYHQRLAAAYESIGQTALAAEHKRITTRLLEQAARSDATPEAAVRATSAADSAASASAADGAARFESSSTKAQQ